MKEIKIQDKTYLFIEIPADAYDFRYKIMPDNTKQLIATIKDENGNIGICYINENPIGEIISTTKDISEEQYIQYLTGKSYLYSTDITGAWEGQVYSIDEDEETVALTAKESLKSLIQANGLDVSKNYLILRKI